LVEVAHFCLRMSSRPIRDGTHKLTIPFATRIQSLTGSSWERDEKTEPILLPDTKFKIHLSKIRTFHSIF
jgi:hypothetical protein